MSGFRRGEGRSLIKAVVLPFPRGACLAAALPWGPYYPAQLPVRGRKPIPTGTVRGGEWNLLCCSELDAVTVQHNLNEIGDLAGVWKVHREVLPFRVWHYLVSGGFLAGAHIMKLLCTSENGSLSPWSHHVRRPEGLRASTGALTHLFVFPYRLAFLIYLCVNFVLNLSLEYKGDDALQERMPALYFTKEAWVKLPKSDPRYVFQCQAELQQNVSVFMPGDFSAQKHMIAILDLYLWFILVLLFKLCRCFPWVRNHSFRLWEEQCPSFPRGLCPPDTHSYVTSPFFFLCKVRKLQIDFVFHSAGHVGTLLYFLILYSLKSCFSILFFFIIFFFFKGLNITF